MLPFLLNLSHKIWQLTDKIFWTIAQSTTAVVVPVVSGVAPQSVPESRSVTKSESEPAAEIRSNPEPVYTEPVYTEPVQIEPVQKAESAPRRIVPDEPKYLEPITSSPSPQISPSTITASASNAEPLDESLPPVVVPVQSQKTELPTIVERTVPENVESRAGPSTSLQTAPVPVVAVKQPEIAVAPSEVVSFFIGLQSGYCHWYS